MKKSFFALGGNDPLLVLKDANLEKAIEAAIFGRIKNNGLDCFAPKRIIAVEEHYDFFKEKAIEMLKKIKYGDPMDPST